MKQNASEAAQRQADCELHSAAQSLAYSVAGMELHASETRFLKYVA
jgi:hypothetical protein